MSDDLLKKFGKGFSFPQLKNIHQFYLAYSGKSYTLCSESLTNENRKPSTAQG
jgi:hypothetical protein